MRIIYFVGAMQTIWIRYPCWWEMGHVMEILFVIIALKPPVEYFVLKVQANFPHRVLKNGGCEWETTSVYCLLWDYLCLLYP